MNTQIVTLAKHQELLNRFNEEYHARLRVYTTQELFYVYSVLNYTPKSLERSTSDIAVLVLKSKLERYIRGEESKPVHPGAWRTLGSRFGRKYTEWLEQEVA